MHEASTHDVSQFLTLTYSDENYPPSGSVDVRPIQLFQKRARFARPGIKLRFFSCGEYSPQRWRAHYHVLAFNLELPDRRLHATSKSGFPVYTSEELTSLWGLGHAYAGDVTYESCAYTARYQLKKINGHRAADHYFRIHPVSGELVHLRPEFVTMSRRPGVGDAWFRKHGSDAFPSDFLILNGSKVPVPPFYLRRLKQAEGGKAREWLKGSLAIKAAREARGALHAENNTPERLAVREEVAHRRFERLLRSFEETM